MFKIGNAWGVIDEGELSGFGVADYFFKLRRVVEIFHLAKVGGGFQDFDKVGLWEKKKSLLFVARGIEKGVFFEYAGVRIRPVRFGGWDGRGRECAKKIQ